MEDLEAKTRSYYFENYETCIGRTDIYIAFLERSLSVINNNGKIALIIPYAFTKQNYGEIMRQKLIKDYNIIEILDLSEYMVFDEAVVTNIILSVENTDNQKQTIIKKTYSEDDFATKDFYVFSINQEEFLKLKKNRFETKPIYNLLNIKDKMLSKSIPLENICLVAYGARLNHKSESIGKEHYIYKESAPNYKPFTEGKHIEKYYFTQHGWLNYKPDEHYNSMFPELFENEKLMFINVIKDKIRFAYDDKNFYNSHTVINCVRIDKLAEATHISAVKAVKMADINTCKKYNEKFLLGLLNSNLMNWYFVSFLSESLHFYPDDAKKLPVPINIDKYSQQITNKVDQILAIKNSDPSANTTALEAEIDRMVYDLYGLTEEEIGVVESKL